MRAATVQGGTEADQANGGGAGGGQSKIEAQGGTLVLSGEDIVSIVVKRFPMQQRPKGLGTDSDIGGRAGGSQAGKERRLQSVSSRGEGGREGGEGRRKGGGLRISWRCSMFMC